MLSHPLYRLIDFDSVGLAEASRLGLAMSGVEWEDVRVDWADYAGLKSKGRLPWGLLPILETTDGVLAESTAIVRHCAALAGLEPEDRWQRARVNELMSVIGDMGDILRSTWGIDDHDTRVMIREALSADDGQLTRTLWQMEDHLGRLRGDGGEGWVAGTDGPSVADLQLFVTLFGMVSGAHEGLDAELLEGFSNLLDFHARVAGLPGVAEHYAEVETGDPRWVFQVGAFEGTLAA